MIFATCTKFAYRNRVSNLTAKLFPPKPDGFLPATWLYVSILLLNYNLIFLTPTAVNTPSFTTIALFSRLLPFSLLFLPYIIPTTWGTMNTHPHSAHSTYTTLFRTISVLSFLSHTKSTAMALFYNTPDAYYRHSLLQPFKEYRSPFDRGTTSFSRVFGAILEHPAVSGQGWDVILSGLSFGVWAAVRGLDPEVLLRSCVPFISKPSRAAKPPVTK